MNITFYNTTSDKRMLTKVLTGALALTVNAKDAVQYKTVVLEMSKGSGVASKNYAYIQDFNAYYFVKVKDYANGFLRLTLELDVRMTFATDIKALSGTVARNEFVSNGYLVDGKYQTLCYREIVTRKFPVTLNNDSLILITVG